MKYAILNGHWAIYGLMRFTLPLDSPDRLVFSSLLDFEPWSGNDYTHFIVDSQDQRIWTTYYGQIVGQGKTSHGYSYHFRINEMEIEAVDPDTRRSVFL